MRRKILSFILALTLMAGMGSIAYAEDMVEVETETHTLEGHGSVEANVTGKFIAAGTPDAVYLVSVSWPEGTNFAYNIKGQRVWDPVNHKYLDAQTGYDWTKQELVISLENKSNRDVTVKATWSPSEKTTYGIEVEVANSPCLLKSAEGISGTTGTINLAAKPESGQNGHPDFSLHEDMGQVPIGRLTLSLITGFGSANIVETTAETTTATPTVAP